MWIDQNGDGLQGADELPLSGVVVQLRDPNTGDVLVEKTTGANGQYLFNTLDDEFGINEPFVIAIELDQPALAGFTPTASNVLANTRDATDSDGVPNGAVVSVSVVSPDDGFDNLTFDVSGTLHVFSLTDCSTTVWLSTIGIGRRLFRIFFCFTCFCASFFIFCSF